MCFIIYCFNKITDCKLFSNVFVDFLIMLNIVGLSTAEDAFISMPVMFVWSADL